MSFTFRKIKLLCRTPVQKRKFVHKEKIPTPPRRKHSADLGFSLVLSFHPKRKNIPPVFSPEKKGHKPP